MSAGLVSALYAWVAWRGSARIDGVRYFWLDDDQMISMRYARNLVEGHGLVWNAGEHVEGITNPGWALVMAAVHALPIADAHTSLVVKLVNLGLTLAILRLTERVLVALGGRAPATLAAVLLPVALNIDVVTWGANGFETPLLTALFLAAVVWLLEDRAREAPRIATFVLAGLIPCVRSDAYGLVATLLAIVALGPWRWRRSALRVAPCLLIIAGSLVLRRAYYGTWLPNTYYLKVDLSPDRLWRGLTYVLSFVRVYAPAIVPAFAWTALRPTPERVALVGGFTLSAAFAAFVGGDMFDKGRFLAPFVPVLIVLAVAAAADVLSPRVVRERTFGILVVSCGIALATGAWSPSSIGSLTSTNGLPADSVPIGVAIAAHAGADATVGVFAAGSTAYFARRRAVDFLGKCDAHVARTNRHPQMPMGHDKFDFDYSLSLNPDYVVFPGPESVARNSAVLLATGAMTGQSRLAGELGTNPRFVELFLPNPVRLGDGTRRLMLYVAGTSKELERHGAFVPMTVSAPTGR